MYHIPRATESLGSTSTAYSGTSMTTTMAPHHGSEEFSSTSKVVIGSVLVCLGVAVLIILGAFFYNRRRSRRRLHKHRVKDPGIVFNNDVFAKKPASSIELDKYMMADLGKVNNSAPVRPQYYRESSSSTSTCDDNVIGRQSQSNFKIADVHEDENMIPTLVFPKPLAKKPRTPRSKPTWLSPITIAEEVKSPPLAYDTARPERQISFPIPPQNYPQMARATLVPTTPRKSRASLKSLASSQSLIIPDFEPMPVVSPARSESFAPKDLDLPSPPPPRTPPANFNSGSAGGQIGFSPIEEDEEVGLAQSRLMTVVARYTPNLPDELHVKLGDIVRIIAEYKDGWCFAQLLGTIDAPKGVIPLVCLQAAFTHTHTHKAPNKSLTTLNWNSAN